MLYIGIDLGTSAVKLLLMDGEGNIKKIVSKEYPLYFPHPGWSEQNPEDWYEQTVIGLRNCLRRQIKVRWQASVLAGRCTDWLFWRTGQGDSSCHSLERRAYHGGNCLSE